MRLCAGSALMLEWTKIKLQTNKGRITTAAAEARTRQRIWWWCWLQQRKRQRPRIQHTLDNDVGSTVYCVAKTLASLRKKRQKETLGRFLFLSFYLVDGSGVILSISSRAYNSYYIQIHLNETIFACIILFSIFTHCSGLLFCWCCFYFVFVTLLEKWKQLNFFALILRPLSYKMNIHFFVLFCECHFVRCFWGAIQK